MAMQKAIAMQFGPAGITLFSHFQNLVSLFTALPSDGVNRGLIRHTAHGSNNPETALPDTLFSAWLRAGLWWNLLIWVAGCLLLLFFRHTFIYEFKGDLPAPLWAMLFFAFEGMYLLHLYLIALMQARLKVGLYVWFTIAGSILQAVLLLAGVLSNRLEWAFLGLAAGQGLMMFASGYWSVRVGVWRVPRATKTAFQAAFSGIGKMVLLASVVAVFGRLVDFFVREYAIEHFNLYQTGLWQAVVKMSDAYITPVTAVIGVAFFPVISALSGKPKELRAFVLETARTVVPAAAGGLLLVYLLREPLLVLLNDARFAPAAALTPLQLCGDFLKILSYFLAGLMLRRVSLKRTVLLEGLSAFTYISAVSFFLPRMGIGAFPAAHLVRYIIYGLSLLVAERHILWGKGVFK